jgi:hypothetical protein
MRTRASKRFGFHNRALIDDNKQIIAGHADRAGLAGCKGGEVIPMKRGA